MTRIAVTLIRIYQTLISPYLGNNCRFYPTCSNYAISVYQEWGFLRGSLLTVKRLLKCGFWNPGGVDLPPKKLREVKQ
ncbi:MAG: membrane protein insertion efficiency factor YidD [Synergistaceae bacterium]|nr:membrane protein insertion efficiency factor YidD [Synergistaceae bacterium]MBQ6001905.1 membrane protein insertion efficiency factor YidD [Synergistaceae bacterium]MBR0168902.1 membrane protein insertion efficiency factor YidD [Synergistaceae bacterium]MBR0184390.1 membrane protein insertion efficiency factor YidD [Synergistaceae bacterium]